MVFCRFDCFTMLKFVAYWMESAAGMGAVAKIPLA
jgi:hypothetical protein